MIFTVLALEVPASSRGAVSLDCPREVYSQLSWNEWTANLPNEWTIFMPLNSRYIPLHDRHIIDGNDDLPDEDSDSEASSDESLGVSDEDGSSSDPEEIV
jgi:hypothetical protein